MADVSGGSVTRVKASELTSNFAGILANPILASQVGWTLCLAVWGRLSRSAHEGTAVTTGHGI